MRILKLFILFSIVLLSCKTEEPQNTPTISIPSTKVIETSLVEVKSKTGRIWMDRNLGASQVATSQTDEKAYGDLYQWGRGADGHQLRTSPTTNTLSTTDVPGNAFFITSTNYDWRSPKNDNLWQGVNGVNNPCPAGFRLPTDAEWDVEIKTWDLSKLKSGIFFVSPLKLTLGGYRGNSLKGNASVVDSVGQVVIFWSSTSYIINSKETSGSISFGFSNSYVSKIYGDNRIFGRCIRCIKD